MNTKFFKIDTENIQTSISKIKHSANVLRSGGLVAFPTETVYGLGANSLMESAIKKIFASKGRPQDNPLIIHFSVVNQLDDYVYLNENALLLAKHFWPGPLTMILKKKPSVSDLVTANLSTVAIRIPANQIARQLIDLCQVPVVAPSANTSGKPSGTKAEHVFDDFQGKVDIIIDGGQSTYGLESTVIDLSCNAPIILRPGYITVEDLKKFIPEVKYSPSVNMENISSAPKSPGMKYNHYSPDAQILIVEGTMPKVTTKINNLIFEYNAKGLKTGVLCTNEHANEYQSENIISLGSRNNPKKIAANLFDSFRKFDKLGVEFIFAECLSYDGISFSVMNRLKKAAGFNILKIN